MMTLDEAIEHCEEVAKIVCDECAEEHIQLAEWLRELKERRKRTIMCRDCKYFEYDHVENVGGIPLIVAHEICMRWGNGVKTSENGYCFLAEKREVME